MMIIEYMLKLDLVICLAGDHGYSIHTRCPHPTSTHLDICDQFSNRCDHLSSIKVLSVKIW